MRLIKNFISYIEKSKSANKAIKQFSPKILLQKAYQAESKDVIICKMRHKKLASP